VTVPIFPFSHFPGIGAVAGFLVGVGSYVVNGLETGDFSLSQFGNRVGAATLSGTMISAGMGLIVDSGGMSALGPNGVGGVSGALIGAGLGSLAGSGVLSTGDVSWSGFGKGALIGGAFGFVAGVAGTWLTATYATTALGTTAVTYSQAFGIGAISFGLGDMAAQTTAVAAGWQDRYNPVQTYGSMALGGVMNVGARWLATPRMPCRVVRSNAADRVRAKVDEMRANMTPDEIGRTTYAAAEVTSADGVTEIWVAGAGRTGYVPPRIRGNARNVKSPAKPQHQKLPNINDAERHIQRTVRRENATIEAIGATRDVCRHCQKVLPKRKIVTGIE